MLAEQCYFTSKICATLKKLLEMRLAVKIDCQKTWKLLFDLQITRSELRFRSGISSVTLAKLGKGENVTTDILLRICNTLNSNIGDIVDVLPDYDDKHGGKGK